MGKVQMIALQIRGNMVIQKNLRGAFQKVSRIQNLEVISVGNDWRTPFWNDIDAGINVSHILIPFLHAI